MKTLYESILDTEKDYDNDLLISMLFNKDIQLRRDAFSTLLKMIESYRPKQHRTTAKMKNSDNYFIEFTWPIKIEYGEATNQILDWISYITICKKNESTYKNVIIGASDDRFGDQIGVYEWNWKYTSSEFNPKSFNAKLYEVPEELNSLFERIQTEAHKHR